MKRIVVCLKRVLDFNVRVTVNSDGSGISTNGLKMSINPFDEIALEEALRLRERGWADEVVVVSLGTSECQQQLRNGLAMGADRAILIETDEALEPLSIAEALHEIVQRESPDLILMGKQSIDGDNNQTGQMLAALWNRPQACFASKIDIQGDTATVAREVDAGIETLEIDLPAIVTADLRLNEPRYIKLPEIMKAKRKPLDVVPLDQLGASRVNQFSIVATQPPAERAPGIRVESVAALFDELNQRGLL